MIKKLSPEQEAFIPVIRDKWINKINKPEHFNKVKAVKSVEWLYAIAKLKKPKVIVCSSPLACQLAMNVVGASVEASVKDCVRTSVDDPVKASVWDSVRDSVWTPVWTPVGTSVRTSVRTSLWDSVRGSAWACVKDSVKDSVRTSVVDSVRISVEASVWDFVGDSVNDSVAASLKDSLWDSVRASVMASANDSVKDSVRDSVWDSVRASVRASVRDSVELSVRASVRASVQLSAKDSAKASVEVSVWDSVRDSVKDSQLKLYETCLYGDTSDFGWTAFYDFFSTIKVLKHEIFDQWLEYCNSGIFYAIQYEGVCAICPIPKYVKRDREGRMHCEDGMAIEWADGYGIYVLDSIRFDRKGQDELYWKIVRHELTLPEILEIADIDQRAIALKYCNADSIINDLVAAGQAELVDSATKVASYLEHNSIEFIDGIAQIDFLIERPKKIKKNLKYDLYKVTIPEIFDEPEFMLVYAHASVDGLSYWKGVDPETAREGSIASIAKYHNMSIDEYLLATSQS